MYTLQHPVTKRYISDDGRFKKTKLEDAFVYDDYNELICEKNLIEKFNKDYKLSNKPLIIVNL